MTREEFWMQIYIKDLGSCKESFHANKALAEFDDRFPVYNDHTVKTNENDSSKWIEWYGGDCPLPLDTPVCVMFRSGFCESKYKAGFWNWSIDGFSGDIIKYRVVKD